MLENQKNMSSYVELLQKFKNLEAQFQHVSELYTIQETYVNRVSSDIKSQLNALVGYSELAKDYVSSSSPVYDYLTKINRTAHFLATILRQAVDVSVIDHSKIRKKLYQNNIVYLVEDVFEMCLEDAKSKQIPLSLNTEKVVERLIYCDKDRLLQILLNVTRCAIMMASDGKISIEVKQKEKNQNLISDFEFVIKNQGESLSQTELELIMNPFAEDIPDDNLREVVTYMYITKNMVELLDGHMELENEIGKESKVTICIPVSLQENQETNSQVNFEGKRVLLVAKDEETALHAEEALTKLALFVDVAADVQMTCDILCEVNQDYYDLIVMDLRMPDLDGYCATKIIRRFENQTVAKMPILAMYSGEQQRDLDMAKEIGITALIEKPLRLEELEQILKSILRL